MVLNTEWTQLELIELLNELPSQNLDEISNLKGTSVGSGGFGFGITGNKSTGVVVKVITQGGSADKDGRLKINDQLFQIGNINVRGMNSEQVAAVLRQSAFHGQLVKFLVARPIQNSISDYELINSNEIINLNQEKKNNEVMNINIPFEKDKRFLIKTIDIIDKKINFLNPNTLENQNVKSQSFVSEQSDNKNIESDLSQVQIDNFEKINIDQSLNKLEMDAKETLIDNDYLIQFYRKYDFDDDKTLIEYINKELDDYGLSINIKEEKYYIIKFFDCRKKKFLLPELFDQLFEINDIEIKNIKNCNILQDKIICFKFSKNFQLKSEILTEKWYNYLTKEQDNCLDYSNFGKNELEIIVGRIDKINSKNLGISLEGTVDLDDNGIEKFPHHYIRSILPNGPIDKSTDTKFKVGDELLEIDSIKLYSVNYVAVLEHLKNLKNKTLILVCARKVRKLSKSGSFADTVNLDSNQCELDQVEKKEIKKLEKFQRETLSEEDRNNSIDIIKSFIQDTFKINQLCVRSRSLELNGLKLWGKKISFITLTKEQTGLGFSLIDYQSNSFNPLSKTMIVIRALVPGGVAHLDGRLMPGQRLVSINDHILDDALIFKNGYNKMQSFLSIVGDKTISTSKDINLLSYAVGILKNLPVKKKVRLGIQNPLPYPDAEISSIQSQDEELNSLNSSSTTTNLRDDHKASVSSEEAKNNIEQNFFKTNLVSNTILKRKKKFFDIENNNINKSEGDITCLKKNCTNGKKNKNKIKFGIAATSAPAILTQASENFFNFYTSASQMRLNTLNFYNQKLKTNKDIKLKSYPDILNLDSISNRKQISIDFESIKSKNEFTNDSKIQNWTKKDRSISVSFPLNTNLLANEKIYPKISSNLSAKFSDSVKFLNKLLFKQRHTDNKCILTKNDRHLIKEDQFHKAFIKNINKKIQKLLDYHQPNDETIDLQIFDIQSILNGNSLFEKKYENEIEYTNEDISKQCEKISFNFDDFENNSNFNILDKIIYKMALHSWPRIILKPKKENLSEIKKDLYLKSLKYNNRKNDDKNKKTSFEKQIFVINQSRSPNVTQFMRNVSDNSYRVRSKSQGCHSKSTNLKFKNNSLSRINFKPSNEIKIMNILGKEIVRLPNYLEKELRIVKHFYPLGIISVDCSVDEGINGCVIKKIEPNSACAKDGRLKVGDYLLSVNNEKMRILTNSSARAILNRASLTSKDVIIIYIPFEDAVKFKTNVNRFEKKKNDVTFSLLPFAVKYPSSLTTTSSRSESTSLAESITNASSSSYTTKSISLESFYSFQNENNNHFEQSNVPEYKQKKVNITTIEKFQHIKNYNQLQNEINEKLYSERSQNIDKIERITVSELKDQVFDEMMQSCLTNELDLSRTLWGPQRIVILERNENQSLGISIVGGKLDVSTQKENNKQINFINGIFVKHVQSHSPAGINGILKIGDRILAVNDIDLTQASHDQAVIVIKNAKSPVKFLIQSLICTDSQAIELNNENWADNSTDSKQNSSILNQQNEYNYSLAAIKEKYNYFFETKEISRKNINHLEKNELFIFHLKKKFPNESLGLSLSGNVNLNKNSVFVCGIYPNSIAHKHGLIKIGDQILEINGHMIYGRAHSNATPLIKSITDLDIYLVILRNAENLKQMFKPTNSMIERMSDLANETVLDDELKTEPCFNSTNCRSSESSSFKANQLEQQNMQKIKLKKGFNGFGISVSQNKNGQLMIRAINSKGVALKDGRLKVGDVIVAVNDIKVNSMKYDDIMKMLESSDQVEFEVLKNNSIQNTQRETKDSEKIFNDVNRECSIESDDKYSESSCLIQKLNDDPKTNVIKVGEETWIEIHRKKTGLGLSIIGGCDTQLPGIIINDIYQNGAAFNDMRLLIGDQILKVDNTDLISVTHDQALNALRQTSDSVKLLIHRSFSHNEKFLQTKIKNNLDYFDNYYHEKFMDILTINLNKKFGKGLGFSIIGHRGGTGIFISHIIKGGCAHQDGRLTVGDLILEVNDENIRNSAYDEVAFLLKTLPQGKVALRIGRFKTSISNTKPYNQIIDQK